MESSRPSPAPASNLWCQFSSVPCPTRQHCPLDTPACRSQRSRRGVYTGSGLRLRFVYIRWPPFLKKTPKTALKIKTRQKPAHREFVASPFPPTWSVSSTGLEDAWFQIDSTRAKQTSVFQAAKQDVFNPNFLPAAAGRRRAQRSSWPAGCWIWAGISSCGAWWRLGKRQRSCLC